MNEPVQLTLHRRTLHVDAGCTCDDLLKALAPLMSASMDAGHTGPFSVVNIGPQGSDSPRVFCGTNVTAALAVLPTTLVIDLAPAEQYLRFALNGVAVTQGVARAVGALLRTTPVANCGAQIAELRQRLELMALLADGYALQQRHAPLADAARHVSHATRSLAEAAGLADNAACLDNLRYGLLPALDAVADTMHRHAAG